MRTYHCQGSFLVTLFLPILRENLRILRRGVVQRHTGRPARVHPAFSVIYPWYLISYLVSLSSACLYHSLMAAIGGDWAGATFSQAGCPGTVADYVAEPSNFANANWAVNSVRIYQ